MSLQRLSGPAAEPVSLDEVKLYLRVDTDAEDATIGLLIGAARELFERETGRALLEQEWEWTLGAWPGPGFDARRALDLPLGPVSAIVEITVKDGAGGETDIPLADYIADLARGRLTEAKAGLWPRPGAAAAGIRIGFTAGFGASGEDVPADIRGVLLALIGQAYENRAVNEGASAAIAPQIAQLLAPYRKVRL
jgi:uncharacterized phiE125 gp8 family phage protein